MCADLKYLRPLATPGMADFSKTCGKKTTLDIVLYKEWSQLDISFDYKGKEVCGEPEAQLEL